MKNIRYFLCTVLLLFADFSLIKSQASAQHELAEGEAALEAARIAAEKELSDTSGGTINACKNVVIDLAQITLSVVAIQILKVAIHEFGHALATAAFDPDHLVGVHLYTLPDLVNNQGDKPVISFGKVHIYASSHTTGYTSLRLFQEPYKNTIMTLAGGTAGASFCMFLLWCITTYVHRIEGHSIDQSVYNGLKDFSSPYQVILASSNLSLQQKRRLINLSVAVTYCLICEVGYAFFPGVAGGDGSWLWERVLDKDSTAFNVVHWVSFLGQMVAGGYLGKKYSDAMFALASQEHEPEPTQFDTVQAA